MEEKTLRDFIFDGNQSSKGKYDALYNFYSFYHQVILKIPRREIPVFPIAPVESMTPENEIEKKNIAYFQRDFDFSVFFDDQFYHHLNNSHAIITVKAALSLALLAGYDSGQRFPTNRINALMTVDDCKVRIFNEKLDIYVKVIKKIFRYCEVFHLN